MLDAQMRKLVYSVAMSLDGYIAGPRGEYDWITPDPDFDFRALFSRFDTLLMGRKTYELMRGSGQSPASMGMRGVVVSSTLDGAGNRDVEVVGDRVAETVARLKSEDGKDIWLFGGGVLFRSMMDAGLVDGVELAVLPILLGTGIPVIPEGRRCHLRLEGSKALPSGTLVLKYSVVNLAAS
jgi:dihydrofolate reductase